jgi:hypothetical protein
MMLEYFGEYRTYFHVGMSYGISESAAYKTIKWVEDMLTKQPDFAPLGKKALTKSDLQPCYCSNGCARESDSKA